MIPTDYVAKHCIDENKLYELHLDTNRIVTAGIVYDEFIIYDKY